MNDPEEEENAFCNPRARLLRFSMVLEAAAKRSSAPLESCIPRAGFSFFFAAASRAAFVGMVLRGWENLGGDGEREGKAIIFD